MTMMLPNCCVRMLVGTDEAAAVTVWIRDALDDYKWLKDQPTSLQIEEVVKRSPFETTPVKQIEHACRESNFGPSLKLARLLSERWHAILTSQSIEDLNNIQKNN